MATPVVVRALASAHIRAIDQWWHEFRPAAPGLFGQELANALELLSAVPNAAHEYSHPTVGGLRRALLRTTRYHVYYCVRDDVVIVPAV